MSVAEKLQGVRFVVDAEGNRAATIIDYALWEFLEVLEDAEETRRLREDDETPLNWEEAKTQLRADGADV